METGDGLFGQNSGVKNVLVARDFDGRLVGQKENLWMPVNGRPHLATLVK